MSDETTEADLSTARYLAECGVPIFLAKPSDDFPYGGSDGKGYFIPRGWQNTKPDPAVLDDWKPGMAVCAVMGHVVDGVDKDPRSGGELPTDLQPQVYGRQHTPSGGTHDLVAPLGVRSRDGIFGGIDVKAGVDGGGHGFLFIAPTVRINHEGQVAPYSWETRPELESLMLVGGDSTGHALAGVINRSRSEFSSMDSGYEGPEYDKLQSGQKQTADSVQIEKLKYWQIQLDDAETWEEGYRDDRGRGWEALARDFAWAIASYAITPWMPMTETEAPELYNRMLPEVIANNPKCKNKWYDGLLEKAEARPVDLPPWSDFDQVEASVSKAHNLPSRLDEYGISDWLIESGIESSLAWTPGMGWLRWTGRLWDQVPEESARRSVMKAMDLAYVRAVNTGQDKNVIKKLSNFLTDTKTKALTSLVKNQVQCSELEFDNHPDLLNVANGVVDLRTGTLREHDPKYKLTKISNTQYIPGFTNKDWDQALTALTPEVREWMQIRFGQAATGYATSDDVMPISQGGGSNGKTTLISVIRNCMGTHSVTVPDKLIHAGPNDHPTELTTLFGARMAFIDETPEEAHLNVPRLKAVLGSSEMTARKIQKNNITWKTTHSLFVMTNYLPIVRSNDTGTTRRLALVKFDIQFPRNDAFRARVMDSKNGSLEACLAWIVEGARLWYKNGKSIPHFPDKVRRDTDEWLEEADPTNEYIDDRLVLDPESAVLVKEVNEDINNWLMMNSMKTWSKNLTATRLAQSATFKKYGLKPVIADRSKKLMEQLDLKFNTELSSKARVIRGIRWRKQNEPMGFDPTNTPTPEFAEELI